MSAFASLVGAKRKSISVVFDQVAKVVHAGAERHAGMLSHSWIHRASIQVVSLPAVAPLPGGLFFIGR